MQRALIAGVFSGAAHGASLTSNKHQHQFLQAAKDEADVTGPSASYYTGKCEAIDRDCSSRQNKLTVDY